MCNSLRAFLGFLYTIGRLKTDLARGSNGSGFRVSEKAAADNCRGKM